MILKLIRAFILATAVTTVVIPVVPVLAQRTAQVRFQPGTTSAKLSGTIKGDEYFDYVLRAQRGQTMSVKLNVEGTNGNGSVFFNILPPGSSPSSLN
jgi:hypothetical protein